MAHYFQGHLLKSYLYWVGLLWALTLNAVEMATERINTPIPATDAASLSIFEHQVSASDVLVIGEIKSVEKKSKDLLKESLLGVDAQKGVMPLLTAYQVNLEPYFVQKNRTSKATLEGDFNFSFYALNGFSSFENAPLHLYPKEKVFVFLSKDSNGQWTLRHQQLDLFIITGENLSDNPNIKEVIPRFQLRARFFNSGLASSLAYDMDSVIVKINQLSMPPGKEVMGKSQSLLLPWRKLLGGPSKNQIVDLITIQETVWKKMNTTIEGQRIPASLGQNQDYFNDEYLGMSSEKNKKIKEIQRHWQLSIISLLAIFLFLGIFSQFFVKYVDEDDAY